MADLMANSGYLTGLADQQDQAAGEIDAATAAADNAAAALWADHGPVCGECITALQATEKDRASAGTNLAGFSSYLAKSLRVAGTKFDSTDKSARESLDRQVVGG
ncbi:type VII secretion target [Mycobacterium decipiens]|uniref:ESX-1 secretion-associated protein n=1 Tax=Mycobacterium decipiens TaxID=1430326 RepID=A0A1X2LVB1_9MYCO|nr:type VII secretion target [Mycobacterium decipiens]OSC40341.1 hypothetical protein B8W66_13645 [Mycobacterium decipiens]